MIAYVFVKISPSLFIGAIFVFPGTVVLVKASGHTQVRSKFSFERHQGSGDVIHVCNVASVFTTFLVEYHHQICSLVHLLCLLMPVYFVRGRMVIPDGQLLVAENSCRGSVYR